MLASPNSAVAAHARAQWMVETDPAHQSVYGCKKDSLQHAAFSAVVTLTLGVLGSTILPVPYAFSKLGVLPGCLIMAVVAFVNDRTCCMLVRASAVTGRTTYEKLAEWAGGQCAKVVTQVSLILLLYGTLCGGLAFLSDVAHMMMLKGVPAAAPPSPALAAAALIPSRAPLLHTPHTLRMHLLSTPTLQGGGTAADADAWQQAGGMAAAHAQASTGSWGAGASVVGRWWATLWCWLGCVWRHVLPVMQADGRPLMLLVVATLLWPLCLQPHIRQFEKAATVGVVVVAALMGIIVCKAIATGFPAVADGQLPLWAWHKGAGMALPEAFAVLGFAFYMQPMLMPLLAEMPSGDAGRKVSEWAVHVVLYGVAGSAYGVVGVFGAATYGAATQSNIMVNDLLAGRPVATLLLYGALLVYLCCGMVTTHYALRASLEVLLTGQAGQLSSRLRLLMTSAILLAALAVACSFPTQAERIFALTGCTAVCLVCYVLPCYIHLQLQQVIHRHGEDHAKHMHKARRRDLAVQRKACLLQPATVLCAQCGHTMCAACGGTAGREASRTPCTADGGAVVEHALPHKHSAGLEERLLQPARAELLCATCQATSWTGEGEGRVHADTEEGNMLSCACRRARHRTCWELTQLLALPVFIVCVGVGCSVAGLWVGALDIYRSWHKG